MKIVLATGNQHKLREFQQILETDTLEIVPQSEFPGGPDVIEDGNSFEENERKINEIISLDSSFAEAYAMLGQVKLYNLTSGGNLLYEPEDIPGFKREIESLFKKAIRIKPNLAQAYANLGSMYLWIEYDFDKAKGILLRFP